MKRIALVLTATLLLTSFGCTRRLQPFPKPEPSGYRPSAHTQKGIFWTAVSMIGAGLLLEHIASRITNTTKLAWVNQQYRKLRRHHRALKHQHQALQVSHDQLVNEIHADFDDFSENEPIPAANLGTEDVSSLLGDGGMQASI